MKTSKSQVLYHFTAGHLLRRIMRDGLTKGLIPFSAVDMTPEQILQTRSLVYGFQWLTSDPAWAQAWATRNAIDYRRNDVRLTVEIQGHNLEKLSRWLKSKWCRENAFAHRLNEFAGSENWWVYEGTIWPHWIRQVEHLKHASLEDVVRLRLLEAQGG